MSCQLLLSRDAKLPILRAGRENDRLAFIRAAGCRADNLVVSFIFNRSRRLIDKLRAEGCRLVVEALREVKAGHMADARVILDVRRIDDLAAVHLRLNEKHALARAKSINCRCEAGRPGSDNHNVLHNLSPFSSG